MDATDIATIAERATVRFRLECLPQYLVPQETDDLAAWRRGEWTLPTPETSSWLAHIRDTTVSGVCWNRVRIIDHPLAEYSEYELYGYQANAAAGEEIAIADRAWNPALQRCEQDFWLFDETPVRMVYDHAGRFLRADVASDPNPYRELRDLALHSSISLPDYLAHYAPRLAA